MIGFAQDFGVAIGGVLAEAGLWLLMGFAVAGLLHAFIPKAWLGKHLGRPGAASVLKGTAIGVPMPLCSCAVIPAAASLRRGGASKGASASFAVATPEIDVPAFSLTWAMLGPVMAVARVLGAAVSAIVAGLLIDAFDPDRPRAPREATSADNDSTAPKTVSLGFAAEPASCCTPTPAASVDAANSARPSLGSKLLTALKYGFVDLPADLAMWLTIGLVASALVDVVLPADLLAGPLGSGTLGIVAAMGLGLVVYVCATGSTPLAAALVAKGLGPGAALAFLLAGPATNPATMGWVYKDLGKRSLVIYLAAIGGVAFLAGYSLQWLAAGAWTPKAAPLGESGMGSSLGAGLLAAVLTYALVKRPLDRLLVRDKSEAVKPCCAHKDGA